MSAWVSEIVEANYLPTPEADRAGRPYPRHYARVKLPWLASAQNPDPISPHPIPVFLNHYHTDRQDWKPLKPGTRVVVIQVDRSRMNPLGLAVIAYGPQNTDDQFTDLRETSEYHKWPGSGGEDRYVDVDTDPVFGSNEDVGRTHEDGRGYGWRTRHPWPGDPNRDVMHETGPGTVVKKEKRLDNAISEYEVVHTGPAVTYTFLLDGVNQVASLEDDNGNTLELDSDNNDYTITTLRDINLTATRNVSLSGTHHGFYGATPVTRPNVTGSKIATNGNPVTALTSLIAALVALGLITDSSS